MKRFYFLSFFIFCLCLSYGQEKKNSYSFFIGTHYSQNKGIYNGQVYYDCFVGENIKQNIVQSGQYLMDMGFLYERSLISNKFGFLVGLSYSQKGFHESGEIRPWNENSWIPYTQNVKLKYYGFYMGGSYNLITRKQFKLSIGELLNPELMDGTDYFSSGLKRFGISSRTFVTLGKTICNKSSIYLMPFFQTALGQYSYKNRISSVSRNTYSPYSTGLSIGLKF